MHKYIHIEIQWRIYRGLSGHGPHIRFGNRVPPSVEEKMLVKEEYSSITEVKATRTGISEDNWVKRVGFSPASAAEVKIPKKWSMTKKVKKGHKNFWRIDMKRFWQVIQNEKY